MRRASLGISDRDWREELRAFARGPQPPPRSHGPQPKGLREQGWARHPSCTEQSRCPVCGTATGRWAACWRALCQCQPNHLCNGRRMEADHSYCVVKGDLFSDLGQNTHTRAQGFTAHSRPWSCDSQDTGQPCSYCKTGSYLSPYAIAAIRKRICKLDNPAAFTQHVSAGCQLERLPRTPRGAVTRSTGAGGGRLRGAHGLARLPAAALPGTPCRRAARCWAGPGRGRADGGAGGSAAQPKAVPAAPGRAPRTAGGRGEGAASSPDCACPSDALQVRIHQSAPSARSPCYGEAFFSRILLRSDK